MCLKLHIPSNYNNILSPNVRILLPTETTSYPQGTELSSSAVYIQIVSVYIFFVLQESNLHAFTNNDSHCNHYVAHSY